MFLTKKGDDMLYRHPHEIILQIFTLRKNLPHGDTREGSQLPPFVSYPPAAKTTL